MIRCLPFLCGCVLLTACQAVPTSTPAPAPHPQDIWRSYTQQVNGMSESQARVERSQLAERLERAPDDETRMRLAYTLSRPNPSSGQLQRALALLAEISPASDWAPSRDALDVELGLRLQLLQAEGRILELQAQLEALKAIETQMIENREDLEGQDP